jgi:hypothetical protein
MSAPNVAREQKIKGERNMIIVDYFLVFFEHLPLDRWSEVSTLCLFFPVPI